jgi:FKBP-type peptidyl-prolyl cis-trans isomerase
MKVISMKKILLACLLFFTSTQIWAEQDKLANGLYAEINTDKGIILIQLEYQKVPFTVGNFVGLAEGIKDSNKKKGTAFYDGTKFHRVINNFMIQGGDRQGNGRGGPGYRFPDEFDDSLSHTGPGILSMANAGADTNGSQFFITHRSTSHLNGKHAVFGHVIKGQDVVNNIKKNDKIKQLNILRIGTEAKAFKADQATFDERKKQILEARKQKSTNREAEEQTLIKQKYPNTITTKSGLQYIVTQKGTDDKKPTKGDKISAHYTGTLLSGKKFDSSRDRGKPLEFSVGVGRVIKGWDEALLDMTKGERRTLIIPPDIAYGKRGRPPIIPANSTLIFDVELVDF